MKETKNRFTRLYLLVMLTLLIGNGWLGWEWVSARENAVEAQTQFKQIERVTQQIRQLREAPVKVNEERKSNAALVQLIQSATRSNGLKQQQLISIKPNDPKRLADTPYLEQQTEVELREVSLEQVVGLGLTLKEQEPGMQFPQLNFQIPPSLKTKNEAQTREFWNVRLLLTSHLYEPKIPIP